MSNGERQNDVIKKENKKALKVFIPAIIVAGLVGGVFGYFSQSELFQNTSGDLGTAVGNLMFQMIPYLVILTEVLTFAAGLTYYRKAKKDYAEYEILENQMTAGGCDDDEALEEAFQKADRTTGMSLVATNVGNVAGFLFFGIFMGNLVRLLDAERFLMTSLALLAFLAGIFTTLKLQQLATDLVKKMNPKMRGSVYDMNFSKKWEACCDEAEMMAIYKASYKAFRTGNITCLVLWVFVCLGDMLFHYGSLPVIAVSVIWLVMSASYYIESFRLEYGKKK